MVPSLSFRIKSRPEVVAWIGEEVDTTQGVLLNISHRLIHKNGQNDATNQGLVARNLRCLACWVQMENKNLIEHAGMLTSNLLEQ